MLWFKLQPWFEQKQCFCVQTIFYTKSFFTQKLCYPQTPCFTQKPCPCCARITLSMVAGTRRRRLTSKNLVDSNSKISRILCALWGVSQPGSNQVSALSPSQQVSKRFKALYQSSAVSQALMAEL